MNYNVAAIMCVFALVIGILSFKENELISIRRKKTFIVLAWILIVDIVFDTIGFMIDGNTEVPIWLYKIVKTIEFALAPTIPAMFARVITRRMYWERIKYSFAALIAFNLVLLIVNFALPVMFEITDELHYTRTWFGYIYLVNLLTGSIILIISSKHMVVQNTKYTSTTLIALIIFVAVGVIFRVFIKWCNSDWIAITVSYFAMIIYFNNNHLKVDSATGLLNRNAFNSKFANIEGKYSTAFVFIDANNLKKINDEEGHGKGDWVLSRIADCILRVYGRYGFCYRYGGDEFVIIFKPGVIRKSTEDTVYCDKYAMIEKMMAHLDRELEKLLETELEEEERLALSYGVSQGYGIYYTEYDKPTEIEYIPAKDAFKLADSRMYENKQKYKETIQEDSGNQEQAENQKV